MEYIILKKRGIRRERGGGLGHSLHMSQQKAKSNVSNVELHMYRCAL